MEFPTAPPFALRGRLLTPLDSGGTRHESDGLLVVDGAGRITFSGAAADRADEAANAIDLRPFVLLPGMVDLHAHLPQLPNAGVGYSFELLTWLARLLFPTEQSWSDPAVADAPAPSIVE